MKKILFLVNHDMMIYNFRLELVEKLLEEGYEVHISSPYGERIKELVKLGAVYHQTEINRHGINPVEERKLIRFYLALMQSIQPDMVLSFTIKPNIYGGMVSRKLDIPFFATITGLGTAIQQKGIKREILLFLYKVGLQKARMVFFQNQENQKIMLKNHIGNQHMLLPGSGVNIDQHPYEEYPEESEVFIFTTIGRIMKEKGIYELLEAARIIKKKYPKIIFRLIGFFDDNCKEQVKKAALDGIVEYMGEQRWVHPFIKESYAIIHPSYHEGMSNVLLEAAATGRPVIASNIPGCQEIFEEGISGLGFRPRDVGDLVRAIEAFICIPYKEKVKMGKAARIKIEKEFDRKIVVQAYMEQISRVEEKKECTQNYIRN